MSRSKEIIRTSGGAGQPGPEKHSVVSVRFKIEEIDRMFFPLPSVPRFPY